MILENNQITVYAEQFKAYVKKQLTLKIRTLALYKRFMNLPLENKLGSVELYLQKAQLL